MILVIDIGNTNAVLGVYSGSKLVTSWRLTTDRNKTGDELGILVMDLFRYSRPIGYKGDNHFFSSTYLNGCFGIDV